MTDLYDRIRIESDGNSLFRAVQYFLTGSECDYEEVRQKICNFMSENQNFFSVDFASSKMKESPHGFYSSELANVLTPQRYKKYKVIPKSKKLFLI